MKRAWTKELVLATVVLFAIAGAGFAQNTLDIATTTPGGEPSPCGIDHTGDGIGDGCFEDAVCVHNGTYSLRTETVAGDTSHEVYVQAGASVGMDHEAEYRASFWFHPRAFDSAHGVRHFVLNTINDNGTGPIRPIRVMYIRNINKDKHQIRTICGVNTGGGAYRGTGTLDIADDWNQIQVEFRHNTQPAPAPADGICWMSIIGGPNAGAEAGLDAIRNSLFTIGKTRIGRMGAANFHPSANGYQCFDDFESYRTLAP